MQLLVSFNFFDYFWLLIDFFDIYIFTIFELCYRFKITFNFAAKFLTIFKQSRVIF